MRSKLDGVKRRSGMLAWLMGLAAVTSLAINAAVWLVPDWADAVVRTQAALGTRVVNLTVELRLLAFAVSTIHTAMLAFAFYTGARVFRAFAAGEVFVPATGLHLRRIGLSLLLFAVSAPVFRALLSIVVTMANPPGQQALSVSLSSNDAILALVAALIVALGHAMAEAARIAEDNEQIV